MYTSFTIENFRLFDWLTVEPLSRVNLIAGQNNVGKTALLEALWLHAGQNNPELAQRLNLWRGLPGSEPGELFSDLFREYNTDSPIKLTANRDGESGSRTLTITCKPRTELATPMHSARIQPRRSPTESIFDDEIVFEYKDGSGNQSQARAWIETAPLALDLPAPPNVHLEGNIAALRIEREASNIDRNASVFMQSLSRNVPQELATRFGRAEIKGHLEDVQEVLKLLEPRLRRLAAVPIAQGPALIYADIGATRIIPVALMGSGFVRLLELTLAFVEVSNGSILIDEIENGLHYAVLQDVWQAINQLSQKFNVQVFATTHSYECIQAARAAFKSNEFDDELTYIRLQRNRQTQRVECVAYDDIAAFDYAMEYSREVR